MKGIITKVLLTICVIGAPVSVYAFPFREDPQSFQNYLNQRIGWDDGSKLYFQDLQKCKKLELGGEYYDCNVGFVTITNPMGTKVCKLKDKGNSAVSYSQSSGSVKYDLETCRYK